MESVRSRIRPLLPSAALTLLIALAVALRIPSLYEPRWYRDEGIFAAIAHSIRSGDTLYADAWDNKPPLIFFTYAAIQAAFGTGVFALHAVTAAFVIATLAVVFVAARRLCSDAGAIAGGGVFVALMCTPIVEGNLALTETYMILFTSLGALALLIALSGDGNYGWIALTGLSCSIAVGYKQVALFDAGAFALVLGCASQHPAGALAVFAGALVVPHLALAGYFLVAGALPDYSYGVAGSIPLYSDLSPDRNPLFRLALLAPAIVVAGTLLARRRRGDHASPEDVPLVWLPFAFAGATASSMPFPHYLQQAVPALALTVAMLVAGREWLRVPPAPLALATAAAAAVAFAQFNDPFISNRQLHPVGYYRNYVSYSTGDRDYQEYERFFDGAGESVRDISATIDEDGAGTTLFAWSELAWLYSAGGYDNPSEYYTSFLGSIIPDAREGVLRALDDDPPAYVVLSDNAYEPFAELNAWVEGRYTLVGEANDWRLYRSKELTGSLPAIERTPAAIAP